MKAEINIKFGIIKLQKIIFLLFLQNFYNI